MKKPVLKFKLLGQPEYKLPSGKLLRLSTRKSEVLLAYLALAPGIRHPRDRLINLLWSDRGEDQARNSLRQSLSSIKKAFELELPDILQIERTTVKLAADQIQVDVHEFERLQVESTPENLSKAAEIYQGELLEGISIRDTASQEWLGNERGRLRRLIVEVLSSLTQLRLAESQHMETIASAERLVEYDPLLESSWRLLMTAYHQKGDRNHALMAYKRCRDNLHKELGVEPDTETNDLQERIKLGDPSKPKSLDTLDKKKSELINTDPDSASKNHSIVVLPFDNLSGDAEQEYFSDGITESIILNLSLFPGLVVKSRNSSFAFKQQIKSLGEISKELNVAYVVEGSIRKAVDRVKITVQLIEANSGNQIWGKRYDAELEELFDLEEELSRTIAATITGRIESDLQRIALSKPAAHQQSYDLLLAGRYHFNKITADNLAIAREKLYQCLEIDGNNVQAHVLLYLCHSVDWLERWTENHQASYRLAGEHCEKALALTPNDVAVQMSYAEFLIFSRKYDEAVNHINRALELNPNDPNSLAVKSFSHTMLGEYEAGVDFGNACMRLDPYHPWGEWNKSEALFYWGHYDEAIETILGANTSPNILPIILVGCYIRKGEVVKARQAMTRFLQSAGESMKSLPATRDEWWQYVYTYTPHQDVSITRKLFEDLEQAGLCDHVADSTDDDQPIELL
jgi:TolB-like protein/Tfp pilus assembly protein PilF/DNA-binding winged helix-turn-helix (wHTH) protein